jgi:hypothetical protein
MHEWLMNGRPASAPAAAAVRRRRGYHRAVCMIYVTRTNIYIYIYIYIYLDVKIYRMMMRCFISAS